MEEEQGQLSADSDRERRMNLHSNQGGGTKTQKCISRRSHCGCWLYYHLETAIKSLCDDCIALIILLNVNELISRHDLDRTHC